MKTSILICATYFIVAGCSAQLRFPSLSSALSSLTGYGASSAASSASQAAQSSPYSGLVRDYGRNLMMAMSSIYPTLFKPPQAQQQQASQPNQQSPYDQTNSQSLFSGQQNPSFSFGGSTFSISPSLPFGSLTGASQAQPSASGSHSPFGASFGSSINSPSSFGPLSSAPFLAQSMPSFAPASSYNSAFEAANGGPPAPSAASFNGGLGSLHSAAGPSGAQLIPQSSNPSPINSFANSIPNFGGHDGALGGSQPAHAGQQAHQQPGLGAHSAAQFGNPQQQQAQLGNQQYSAQQYRPEMMSIAASAPVPSSNTYSSYAGQLPSSVGGQQQAPSQSQAYQQPSYS